MTTTDPYIAYWLDKTSDASEPRWIVSEERDGGSTTLRVLDEDATEDEARAAADAIARERRLPVQAD